MPEVLLVEKVGRVRVLRLHRPDARNALSTELVVALHTALLAAEQDDAVGAVVLAGSDPAFCAGVDLKEAVRDGAAYFDVFRTHDCIGLVGELTTPVIGAINGASFTGGLELALGCDFLVASERAVFADTHARVGVLPGGGMTARLPRAVGGQRARRMSLTGEVVGAAEALRIGLVTEVLPHDRLMSRAIELAAAVAELPDEVVLPLKQMYIASDGPGLAHALAEQDRIASSQHIDHDGLEARRVAVMSRNHAQLSPIHQGDA